MNAFNVHVAMIQVAPTVLSAIIKPRTVPQLINRIVSTADSSEFLTTNAPDEDVAMTTIRIQTPMGQFVFVKETFDVLEYRLHKEFNRVTQLFIQTSVWPMVGAMTLLLNRTASLFPVKNTDVQPDLESLVWNFKVLQDHCNEIKTACFVSQLDFFYVSSRRSVIILLHYSIRSIFCCCFILPIN